MFNMLAFIILLFTQVMFCQSTSQKSETLEWKQENNSTPQNLKKLQELLLEKLKNARSNSKVDNQLANTAEDLKNLGRKSKSLPYYPYLLPHLVPFGPPSSYYFSQNKDLDSSYANEWMSRTEPFKRNTALLDSPTYYIRLPPNPYAFVPGLGYVSQPPSLSEPQVFDSKPETSHVQPGNDLFHDPFYRLPINFVSNGKPTSVYQLSNDQPVPKPDANLVNLNKGPYVFNGKPSEIFLVAQIYNALYGDELNHFYP